MFFLPDARQSEIGADGHAKRGGFLPPVHELPRRMWAGSRLAFPGEIRVGDPIVRHSIIQSVKRKDGASGPLVFVTVRHEIGKPGGAAAIIDEHDIVYRGLEAPAVKPSPQNAEVGGWRRELVPDAVQLFRYSALTFNGHRPKHLQCARHPAGIAFPDRQPALVQPVSPDPQWLRPLGGGRTQAQLNKTGGRSRTERGPSPDEGEDEGGSQID